MPERSAETSWPNQRAGLQRLLLVANEGEGHVGAHLYHAAGQLGYTVQLCNSESAFEGYSWTRRLNWHLRGHRPPRLKEFGLLTLRTCANFYASCVLATGVAPLEETTLRQLGELGVRRINFLTDDPWNKSHYAPWFIRALPHYDHVYSPRRSNLEDLRRTGCLKVSYLPFAYSPHTHFFDSTLSTEERQRLAADVIFAGGADRDRLPWIRTLICAGFNVALYGGYWDRQSDTKKFARGIADGQMIRRAVAAAKIALCLVRRANRDGHAMRTFELAAMQACILAEDTSEHREILGEDGQGVVYFRSGPEMVEKARWLLEHDDERRHLAALARERLLASSNTYADRLLTMLKQP